MNKKMVKDVAEIKSIPFKELQRSDTLLLSSFFADVIKGIRSERDYFCRANQGASVLDVYFEENSIMHTDTQKLPSIGVCLNFVDQEGEKIFKKQIDIPNHVKQTGEEGIISYLCRPGRPKSSISVDGLDVMNNMKWFDCNCLVLREKATKQENKDDNASGALPFCITAEIKRSALKYESKEACVEYMRHIEVDMDCVELIQRGHCNELYKEFCSSNLGSTFLSRSEKWDEVLNLVKRPDITFEELGNAITAWSPFERRGNYLKELNEALGALFLSDDDFFKYARSVRAKVQTVNEKKFKMMLMDRGIRATEALGEVKDLFRSMRIGPRSSALSRIFAHLLLSRLPHKEVLLRRHNSNIEDIFYKENKDDIQCGKKVRAGGKSGGEIVKIENKDKKLKDAIIIIKKLCSEDGKGFTKALKEAAARVGVSVSLLKKEGISKGYIYPQRKPRKRDVGKN